MKASALSITLLLLYATATGIGSVAWWSGPALILVWLLLGLCGLAVLGRDGGRGPGGAVLVAGTGLAVALGWWLLAAYVRKDPRAGTWPLLATAALGAFRWWRGGRTSWRDAERWLGERTAAIAMATVFCALVILGNDFRTGDTVHYLFRYDWSATLHFAALVRENGLPQIGTSGNPGVPWASLQFSGFPLLAVGVEHLTHTNLYQAAKILAAGAAFIITCSAHDLVGWRNNLGRILVAGSPLVWAGLVLPVSLATGNWWGCLDPYRRSVLHPVAPAGSQYHSLTQLLSIALGFTYLLAMRRFRTDPKLRNLVLAIALLGASALVKPSLFIVLAPATLLTFLLHRMHPKWFLSYLAGCLAIFGLIALPSLIESLPPGVAWTMDPRRLLDAGSATQKLVLLGGGLLPLGAWAGDLFRRRSNHDSWILQDLLMPACLGGLVFSWVFLQERRQNHGNHTWPVLAAIVLCAPYWTAWFLQRTASLRRPVVRMTAAIVLGLHLLGGLLYLGYYPFSDPKSVPRSRIAVLERAGQATPPGTRFLVDPALAATPLWPFLGRPAPFFPTNIVLETQDYRLWNKLARHGTGAEAESLLRSRDAVLVGRATRHLVPVLKRLGWRSRRVDESGEFELWLAPRSDAPDRAHGHGA